MIGGFPCKSFSAVSTTWRRGTDDKEYGDLYKYMIEAIKNVKPKFFVAENVPGILSAPGGKEIIEEFNELDYSVITPVVNFADYGVAQIRKRVLIIGTDFPFLMPEPTTRKHIPCGDALIGVEKVPHNNEIVAATPRESEILPHIKEGENAITAMRLRKPDLLSWTPYGQMYRRISRFSPAPTVVGTSKSGGGTYKYHYSENRRLTNRELARLFGYPDDFVFSGSITQVKNQIANSVPPTGIEPFASALLRAMDGEYFLF